MYNSREIIRVSFAPPFLYFTKSTTASHLSGMHQLLYDGSSDFKEADRMDCIFCKIVEGYIPSKKVLETDTVYAFHDIHPAAPVHVLLIPKKHIATMNEVTPED